MLPIPRRIWQRQESQNVLRNERSLGIMSEAHHRVRNLAVKELVRVGKLFAPPVQWRVNSRGGPYGL